MTTNREELEALLYQTRLRIEDNQKDEMLNRLNKDLAFIEELFEVNVDNISPLYHVIDLPEYLREDVAGETLKNEVIMDLCRSGEYGYIVVPAVPAALENSEHQAKKSN
ncbi:Asp-tRNA(Asn)/Glu-tRNA(Gln) amidotransferase subunit GatC [Brachyspira pilosicoli]|uniref:Asp-tRNA(Asn)/Glu-tRNA(Gln) amidotransferase subunit GatC n=1 Tax=Brachyspira pilosicoli TaxID=52584 RepID=UPI003003B2EC